MTLESQRDGEPALLFHWSSPTFNKVGMPLPASLLHHSCDVYLQLIPGGYSGPKGRSGGLTKDEIYEPSDDLISKVRGLGCHGSIIGVLTFAVLASGGKTHGTRSHHLRASPQPNAGMACRRDALQVRCAQQCILVHADANFLS